MLLYTIVVPIKNAESYIPRLLPILLEQLECDEIIIIDSESSDASSQLLSAYPITYIPIAASDFDHGETRDKAMRLAKNEIVVFLTQDALPARVDTLKQLVSSFDDPLVAMAYARQLPRPEAKPIEAHARLFNYPDKSQTKRFEERDVLGIKTVFCSNSCAAYRKTAYEAAGGFPTKLILSEDTFIAGKILMSGYAIHYNANACVYHSHEYTVIEEFKRYFDIGVFHVNESWIRAQFGAAEGEGARFVSSELSYVGSNAPYLIPQLFIRNGMKLLGYRVGMNYKKLPLWLVQKLSMHKHYWKLPV